MFLYDNEGEIYRFEKTIKILNGNQFKRFFLLFHEHFISVLTLKNVSCLHSMAKTSESSTAAASKNVCVCVLKIF